MINLAYITSCRWVDTTGGGLLESLASQLRSGEGPFAQVFRLVAVVVDDDDDEFARAWSLGQLWPGSLAVPGVGARADLASLTLRIPSRPWRELRPTRGERKRDLRAVKAKAKSAYEQRMVTVLAARGVGVVLADSYLPVFGPDMLRAFPGRILNVHPAITDVHSPHRIVGRTPTRDSYTRAAFGWIIVDDKRRLAIPPGPRVGVIWNGRSREAVEVPARREGGFTVHVVTAEVDAGPVILSERYVITDELLSMGALRRVNSQIRETLVPMALLRWHQGILASMCTRAHDSKLRTGTADRLIDIEPDRSW